MLFEIPELGRYVWISAFDDRPSDVTQILDDASKKFPGTCVQLVDLEKVAGSRFLFVATYNALKSFNSKHRISRSLAMEILLYVSANRQIAEALARVGVTSETEKIAALVVGSVAEEVSATGTFLGNAIKRANADRLLDEWSDARIRNVRASLDIRDKELNAILEEDEESVKGIERLAIERSALLAVKK